MALLAGIRGGQLSGPGSAPDVRASSVMGGGAPRPRRIADGWGLPVGRHAARSHFADSHEHPTASWLYEQAANRTDDAVLSAVYTLQRLAALGGDLRSAHNP